ncbi:MAG TPA: hypothetical protein VNZ27_07705 [Rhodanobacter sp.]|nr:hypothetical protein [Rhodanobacter sp.]
MSALVGVTLFNICPDVIVANGPGEKTIVDILDHRLGRIALAEIADVFALTS